MQSRAQQKVARWYRRQNPDSPKWGSEYEPANRAVRGEAPKRSRPTIIHCATKLGRAFHAMSLAERNAALLALYHPRVIEIHEQRVLDPAPTPHPLHGHPGCVADTDLMPLPGTWATAQELCYGSMHPRLLVENPDGSRGQMPSPLVGDLLLIMTSSRAQSLYCVNWNIKGHASQFLRTFSDYTSRNPSRDDAKAVARRAIEKAYYAAAGIPTYEISADELPPELVANLADMIVADSQCDVPAEWTDWLAGRAQECIGSRITPKNLCDEMSLRYGVAFPASRNALLSAIWHRLVKVDLFERVFFDRPLRSEQIDVLEQYGDWFMGESS